MNRTDIAWSAGFFDGEGTIRIIGNSITLYLSQKDVAPLCQFQRIFNRGTIYHRDFTLPNGKPTHINTYYVSTKDAIIVLSLMLPFLTVKHKQASKAVTLWSQNKKATLKYVEVFCLHRDGLSFQAIARIYGISKQRAYQLYQDYKKKYPLSHKITR